MESQEIKKSYVKIRDVIDHLSFKFWNKGTWSSGKLLFSDAKTKTVHGGNFRINTKNCKTKTVNVHYDSKYTKAKEVKCKSGKVDENNWMSAKRKF